MSRLEALRDAGVAIWLARAFADHGRVGRPLGARTGEAEVVLRRVAAEGIDLEAVGAELEGDGVDAFCASYRELLDRIAAKTRSVVPA